MARKRQRIDGMKPRDTLSSSDHGSRISNFNNFDYASNLNSTNTHLPKRHRMYYHHGLMSSKDFVPSQRLSKRTNDSNENLEGKLRQEIQNVVVNVRDEEYKGNEGLNKDYNTRDNSNSSSSSNSNKDNDDNDNDNDRDEDDDFEALRNSSPLSKIKSQNFLSITTNTNNNSTSTINDLPLDLGKHLSIKNKNLKSSGTIYYIDSSQTSYKNTNYKININIKENAVKLTIIPQNSQDSTAINIERDCEKLIFDNDFTTLGIKLNNYREIKSFDKKRNERKFIKTRFIIWSTTIASSHQLRLFCDTCEKKFSTSLKIIYSSSLYVNDQDIFRKFEKAAGVDLKRKSETEQSDRETSEELKAQKPRVREENNHKYSFIKPSGQSSKKFYISNKDPDAENALSNISNGIPAQSFYSTRTEDTKPLSSFKFSNLRNSNVAETNTNNDRTGNSKVSSVKEARVYEIPEDFSPKLNYKFEDGSVHTITNQDFRSLYNHEWINDSILNFFIKYYVEKSVSDGVVSKNDVAILSSFFFSKLISTEENQYHNVKKWVSNSDLFLKRYIVIPINTNYHWIACIISGFDELYYDLNVKRLTTAGNKEVIREHGKEKLRPSYLSDSPKINIYLFDSLSKSRGSDLKPLVRFIIEYAFDKCKLNIKPEYVKIRNCLVPEQPNMSDCGVHVILNIKKFFENPIETATIWKHTSRIGCAGDVLANTYFEKQLRGQSRKNLRDVLFELQKKQLEQQEESETKLSNDEQDESNEDIVLIEKSGLDEITQKQDNPDEASKNLCSEPPSPKLDNMKMKISNTSVELKNSEYDQKSENDDESNKDLHTSTNLSVDSKFIKSLQDKLNPSEEDNHATNFQHMERSKHRINELQSSPKRSSDQTIPGSPDLNIFKTGKKSKYFSSTPSKRSVISQNLSNISLSDESMTSDSSEDHSMTSKIKQQIGLSDDKDNESDDERSDLNTPSVSPSPDIVTSGNVIFTKLPRSANSDNLHKVRISPNIYERSSRPAINSEMDSDVNLLAHRNIFPNELGGESEKLRREIDLALGNEPESKIVADIQVIEREDSQLELANSFQRLPNYDKERNTEMNISRTVEQGSSADSSVEEVEFSSDANVKDHIHILDD
ncbi:hypothetical protein Kpol_1063p8 [Vanderwaltozyma polyspora DSM 70294]|uniref:Ubiquitin-like protease family profile domain-containing protein n=1 Tax=Vanderwaltozyma polyspora (strain ATCC 22028 / DSM 70294 / BCRC 21397 / CBS 2163 / NBRC 10782 / NRRL Y-8283 / UCD 57-17) TaxID=436907 RepID=A7TQQ3_VANPO|nr:uncharacterized protein Kpol_1063p8 [Vanderwaltozyma polyspora DSM 70294]EDO15398.1 hypothetical protein Kpol_1063p8 [Vanderwaltozyma polyspora DSM 70294]